MKLLNVDTNAKTVKGQAYGFLTGVLYLAPADLSGRNVCPMASKGCKAACLNTAGRGAFNNVQEARKRKTDWYFADRPGISTRTGAARTGTLPSYAGARTRSWQGSRDSGTPRPKSGILVRAGITDDL